MWHRASFWSWAAGAILRCRQAPACNRPGAGPSWRSGARGRGRLVKRVCRCKPAQHERALGPNSALLPRLVACTKAADSLNLTRPVPGRDGRTSSGRCLAADRGQSSAERDSADAAERNGCGSGAGLATGWASASSGAGEAAYPWAARTGSEGGGDGGGGGCCCCCAAACCCTTTGAWQLIWRKGEGARW